MTTTQLTAVSTTEESTSYKRKRMKEVRAMVATSVKHDCRVDQIGFEGSDITRSQIALQDLLAKEKDKHARARHHILNLKNENSILVEAITLIKIMTNQQREEMSIEVNKLLARIEELEISHSHVTISLGEVINENQKLITERDGLKMALKGALDD